MRPPDDLRTRVARDTRPVRPLLRPWQRLLILVPAIALAGAATPALFGLRGDLPQMGPLLAWGGSLVQIAIAVALVAAALREAVPGDAMPRATALMLLAAGAAVTVGLALATHVVSPEARPRVETFVDWLFCWRGALLTGLPLLLLLLVLTLRGLIMRPLLAGALAGMAAGAAVEGGWRLYCSYSHPVHAIGSHGGAVLALTILGIAVCAAASKPTKR